MTNPRSNLWIDVQLLARFVDGLSWNDILALDSVHSRGWWRDAVAAAEERGHLEWDAAAHVWRLTEDGASLVACAGVPLLRSPE